MFGQILDKSKERHLQSLYFTVNHHANRRLDEAFECGVRLALRLAGILAAGLLLLLFLGSELVRHAHGQTRSAPIQIAQINTTLYVGQVGYPTIQSAVTKGCSASAPGWQVVIQAGAAPSDTPAAAAGCAGVWIRDERTSATVTYTWNGSAYAPPAPPSTVVAISPQPTGGQTIQQPAGTTLAVSSFNNALNADLFPGATLDLQIAAADAQLGSSPGVITVNSPGAIASPFTVGANHALVINAPITLAAKVNLGSGVTVACQGAGSITVTNGTTYPFEEAGTSTVSIRNCPVHGPAGYLLHVTGTASHISLVGDRVDGMGLFHSADANNTNGVTDLLIADNTDTYTTTSGSNSAGVYGFWVVGARIHGNSFSHTFHGVQWWGGDASSFNLATGLASDWEVTGNTCDHVFQACIWGSMGSDITVAGNNSDTNGDVAFDSEGGVRVNFTGNSAKVCGSGCGAWFFAQQDLSFTGSVFEATGSDGFLGKNASVNPGKQNRVNLLSNTITCATLCNAALLDAVSQLHIEANQITNGIIVPTSYTALEASISGNKLDFLVPLPSNGTAIAVPAPLNGATLVIDNNVVRTEVAQPSGTTGILATNVDYNSPNYGFLTRNKISGFATGILTQSNGGNGGVPMFWNVERNTINATTAIAHTATNTNETYRQTQDNLDYGGHVLPGTTVGQFQSVVVGPTAAAVGAQATATLNWPNYTAGTYSPICGVYTQAGAPALVNNGTLAQGTATSITVTIQATTAAAATGIVVCSQFPHNP